MSNFGDIVRECREAEQKSLTAVAELAGITKSHVHDIEKGKSRNPTIDTIMRLCHALNIAPSRLLNPAVRTIFFRAGLSFRTVIFGTVVAGFGFIRCRKREEYRNKQRLRPVKKASGHSMMPHECEVYPR